MTEVPQLDGKTAVVTGAGSGIGALIARSLWEAGAQVAGVDINSSGVSRMAQELNAGAEAQRFLPIVADVSSVGDTREVVEATERTFGQVDILVNNAGVGTTYPRPAGFVGPLSFWEADLDKWLRTIAINNNGPFLLARLVVQKMIERRWGRIVNVGTSFATMLSKGRSAYGPSKAGLEASTLIWSKDLAGTGVTVNLILPGGTTDTPLKGGIDTGVSTTATGRPLLKTDIFRAPIKWLASEASDGITGSRFIAKDWDVTLDPAIAAEKSRSPAAWESLIRP